MKVAVTGAAGFLATNLINALHERGDEIVAIDRVKPADLPANATFVEGDVLDPKSMRKALKDVEIVYHLVAKITLARHDEVAWTLNTEGVRVVAEAALASGVRRMVHCSSVHAFDQRRDVCGGRLDETSPRSTDPNLPVYDRSKFAGEEALREVIAKGLDAVIVNPTGVYGPVDHPKQLSRLNGMLRDSARGRVPAVLQGSFDLVDVRDVTAGLIAAGERGKTGENYLLVGQHVHMLEAFQLAARVAGRRGPSIAFPLFALRPLLPLAERIGALFNSDLITEASISALHSAPAIDGGKAARDLGYTPRSTEETIRDLVAFFIKNGLLDR